MLANGWVTIASVSTCVVTAACGASPSAPSDTPPVARLAVTAVALAAGVTTGGTAIAITGANFVQGVSVTVAGNAATDVQVASPNALTARTAPGRSGTGDVVVTGAGGTAVLPNAFTYAMPGPTPDPAPVIRSITARGARRNQPSNFADLGETLTLSAVVEDRETPADALAVTWQPALGRVEGQGTTVQWTLTPGQNLLRLLSR